MKPIAYTETFFSIQGEAANTGRLCTWLRFFSCNLQCQGFGQKEPGNPDSWEPQRMVDPKDFIELTQVPTPTVGCDSDYSWNAKFKHLVKKNTAREIADLVRNTIPDRSFKGKIGHVFTGGEPMIQQQAIIDIIECWVEDGDVPAWVAYETNGTKKLLPVFKEYLQQTDIPMYFSISPKLLHVAGEQPSKAIKPECLSDMIATLPDSYLKFVLNEDPRAWEQCEQVIADVKKLSGVDPEVWVMPVGAHADQQLDPAVDRIADKAIFQYGWNVSPRVHIMIWSDQIGR